MKTTDFDYYLPPESIAQTPIEPRDASRLLVLDRFNGTIQHQRFTQIGEHLQRGDVLVLNQTRVISARLAVHKIPTGGKGELLLLKQRDHQTWEALVGGKGFITGRLIQVENGPQATITANLGGSQRLVTFHRPIDELLPVIGQVPLPPYIHTPLSNPERYQTVYATDRGSAAAPTAGLHFTPDLIEELGAAGIQFAKVTLHVGLDTFAPVTEEDPADHAIHSEWCHLSQDAAIKINQARRSGKRVIAVGTTAVRTIESAAQTAGPGEDIPEYLGPTNLFILPGYTFRAIDAMITNFHLPRSTLIMLVSAFAGREHILNAYQTAIQDGYRFYSFGDAMFIH
jgi:S-adenosylmethionine:tRNA ribosyltransferase-isomerase